MHKHEFIFTHEGNAVCVDPTCAYRFRLKEVKEILSNIANGEAAQPSVQADNNRREQTWRCPKCSAEMYVSVDICGCGYCR